MPIIKCDNCGYKFATKVAFNRHRASGKCVIMPSYEQLTDKECKTMTIVNENERVKQAEAKAAANRNGKIEISKSKFVVVVTVIDASSGKILDTTDYPTTSIKRGG